MNLTLELSGLNLERLLRAAGACGVRMKNVRRMDERTMRVVVPAAQKKRMAALCEKYGWQMAEIRAGGLLRLARGVKRRWTLGISVLLSIFWVYLSDALALAVPGLAHAAARYEGSTLVVDCQRAREGERAGVAGQGAEIVAAREGVIVRISAESGTPRVKLGQAVRKGQTLISGQERTGGGETRACRAQGEIIARCFARGEARVRLNVTGTVETGEIRRRVRIESPKGSRLVRDAPDFDRQDVSVELQPIVGLYLPVWRRVETLARTVLTPRSRSVSDARSQAQGAAENHYPTMSIDELCALPVPELAAKDCALFLWATFPQLPEALRLIRAWGFRYKTVAFVWLKRNRKSPSWFYGMGYWTRSNAEICLLATKGKPKRQSAGVHQFIISPIEQHSKKPDEARDKILALMGDLPRVELFARQKTPGWDAWGNEIASDITLAERS